MLQADQHSSCLENEMEGFEIDLESLPARTDLGYKLIIAMNAYIMCRDIDKDFLKKTFASMSIDDPQFEERWNKGTADGTQIYKDIIKLVEQHQRDNEDYNSNLHARREPESVEEDAGEYPEVGDTGDSFWTSEDAVRCQSNCQAGGPRKD